jgi:hypothetical protein
MGRTSLLLALLFLLATVAAAAPPQAAPKPPAVADPCNTVKVCASSWAGPAMAPLLSAPVPQPAASAPALLQPLLASAALDASARVDLLGASVRLNISVAAGTHPGGSGGNTTASNATAPPPVPCSDPRGCPDLLVDTTKMANAGFATIVLSGETFSATNCNVVEGSSQEGVRRLIRFDFTTPNLGDGDLIIGDPTLHPEWFQWGLCHNHWHFREYAAYRLWTVAGYVQWQAARAEDPNATADQALAAHPALRSAFVAGHKQGFCAKDVDWYLLVPSHFPSCATQGITAGWADRYSGALDGQFVDVTGVAPGPYVLEAEVNPQHFYIEKSYSNNAGAVVLVLPPPVG